MGQVLGSCAVCLFRCLPRRLFVGHATKVACESPLTDEEIREALRTAPLVHKTTPAKYLPGRVCQTVQMRMDQAAGPRSQAKTGDVVLFVDPALSTLLHLRGRPVLAATRGGDSLGLRDLQAGRQHDRESVADRADAARPSAAGRRSDPSIRRPAPADDAPRVAADAS